MNCHAAMNSLIGEIASPKSELPRLLSQPFLPGKSPADGPVDKFLYVERVLVPSH